MKEQKMGIDYFCIETDIKDDDKVFALRYLYATKAGGYDVGAGYAAFGRLIDLLADIYREGFAAEMSLQRRVRLSQQMGYTPEELDAFIADCVDVGLFDRGIWEQAKVLTSRGIQRRYYIVASRRTGTIPESQRRWLLPDEEGDGGKMLPPATTPQHDVTSCTHDDAPCDDMPEADENGEKPQAGHSVTSCTHDAATLQHDEESCPLREEKRREEKEREENLNEREDEEKARDIDAAISNLSKTLRTPPDSRTKRQQQPYPLSCLSQMRGEALYDDGMGKMHDTPWDALVMHLRYKAPDCDVASFAAAVSATCPATCPEDAECTGRCFELISGALDKLNRNKCGSPIPLVRKVLTEDREKGAR